MIAADQQSSWVEQHACLSWGENEPDWLKQQRDSALAHFEHVGLPGIRDEEWRYTNLRALKSQVYSVIEQAEHGHIKLNESSNARLVFVDGLYNKQLSCTDLDISFQPLSLVLETDASSLETAFGQTLPAKQHGFTALNTAYCRDGFVLSVKANEVLEQTLEVVFVHSVENTEQATISHCRNLIMAGANSKLSIVERHIGTDGNVYLNNSITEIIAGDNAHIDHYKIQQESDDAFHIGGVFLALAANAQVKTHSIALKGLVTRNDVVASLLGQGSHIEMNGLVLGQGRQHIDNHTEVVHAVPNCSSDEFYKSLLDDHSRSIFRGRIVVAEDAQLTKADQQNNNLLLSKHAEADTKPQLEIYADDVICSHGATVGQLDPKSIFYLRSRGIDSKTANALLSFAFANEVIERIQVLPVREEITHIIAGSLLSDMELSDMEDIV